MSGSFLFLLLMCLYIGSVSCETKCYKNDEIGDNVGNVYYCNGDTPDCCERDSEFRCCETQGSKNGREQAQLWGTVAALVIIIGLLFVCCKNDYSLCNGDDRTLMERMGLSRSTEPAMTRLSRPGEGGGDQRHLFVRDGHTYPYSSLPPLPPPSPFPGIQRPPASVAYHHPVKCGDRSDAAGTGLYPPLPQDGGYNKAGYTGRSNAGYLPDEEGYGY